jgi:hypothetical protein
MKEDPVAKTFARFRYANDVESVTLALFVAHVPMVLGLFTVALAPATLATSEDRCWDLVRDWARESKAVAALHRKQRYAKPPWLRRSLRLWASYDLDASRESQIEWLRQQYCLVMPGHFADGPPGLDKPDLYNTIHGAPAAVGSPVVPWHPDQGTAGDE